MNNRYLDPTNDVAFKKLFGLECHKHFTVQEPELIEAYQAMEQFNWTRGEMEAYIKANIALTDEYDARKKEREEGREEGEKSKAKEIAKVLKGKLSLEEVSRITGLTEDEISLL